MAVEQSPNSQYHIPSSDEAKDTLSDGNVSEVYDNVEHTYRPEQDPDAHLRVLYIGTRLKEIRDATMRAA